MKKLNLRWRWLLGLSFMWALGMPGAEAQVPMARNGMARPEIKVAEPVLQPEFDLMVKSEYPVMKFGQTARRAKSAVCDTVRLEIGWWVSNQEFPIYLALAGDESASGVIDWGDGQQTPCSAFKNEAGEWDWTPYGHEYENTGTYELLIYTSSPDVQIVGVHVDTYGENSYYSLVNRIDVRRNPSLECLICEQNSLDSLDVTQNPALQQLHCDKCNLTTLDVSKNPKLQVLSCVGNKMEELVLGQQDSLLYVDCYSNRLTSLNLSGCPALKRLSCNTNRLSALDVSKSEKLEELICYDNQLKSLVVSKNTALETLACHYNQLTSLDVSKNVKMRGLYCYNNQLASLDVSKDTALVYLSCYNNRLASLDVSKDTSLVYLYCYSNQLTSLDVTKNTALAYLYCNDNQLASLDVSKNAALMRLDGYNNQLSSLDVTKNEKLQVLQCQSNQLSSLDVSKDTALVYLYCYYNQLAYLDVTKNKKLEAVVCASNQLTSLDLTKNPELQYVECSYNQLEWATLDTLSQLACTPSLTPQWKEVSMAINGTLDLTAYMAYKGQKTVCNFSQMPAADYTFADGRLQFKRAGYYTFSLSNPAVMQGEDSIYIQYGVSVWPEVSDTLRWTWEAEAGQYLDFGLVATLESPFMINWGDGKDTVVKISSYWGVDNRFGHTYTKAGKYEVKVYGATPHFLSTRLVLNSGNVQSLALGGAPYLTYLECTDNQLTSLDVSKNEKLQYLYCYANQLTSLDISKNEKLEELYCNYNQLASLDVSKNEKLERLYCYANQLTSLDVSKDTALAYFSCGANQLTSLDVSKNVKLRELNCHYNRLTALDVSKDTVLTRLSCLGNQLASLDVSKNGKLEVLLCHNNRLAALDVTKNTALRELYCHDNRLAALDVTKNTALRELYCYNNRLTALDLSAQEHLYSLYAFGNFREVTPDAQRAIALSALPGLDAQKMAAIYGGRLDEAGTHLIFESDTVGYDYETGYRTVRFWLLAAKPGETQIPLTAEFFPDEIFRAYVAVYDKDGNDSLSVYERGVVTEMSVAGTEGWSRGIKRLDGLRYFEGLTYFDCRYNDLTALEVPGNLVLTQLMCDYNQLTSLDVSKDTALVYLSCNNNQLTSLEVSKSGKLEVLECVYNQLTSLDVSKDTALTRLSCFGNQLTSLDVSKNIHLTELYCAENRMPLSAIADIQTDSLSLLVKECTPQHIPVELDLELEETLDLTSEMRIKGMATGVDFGKVPASAYTFADGILEFKEDGTYQIRLTNDSVKSTRRVWDNGEYYVEDTVKVFYDITVKPLPPVDPEDPDNPAIEGVVEAAPFAYVQGHTVYLTDGLGEVEAFTAMGQRVYRGHDSAITLPRPGMYILSVVADGRRCKVVVR